MKKEYGQLCSEATKRLKDTCDNADDVQERLLLYWINQNSKTEYGIKYGFSEIHSIKDFQEKVPLTSYEDYDDYISRIIEGEENVLTFEPTVYFCISSGTTGEEKYFPVTESDLNTHIRYAHWGIFGAIREYYSDLNEGDLFGKIFYVGEFANTRMPDGRMNGIRSGCIYQWMNRSGDYDVSGYCVPREVLFPDTLEDLLYVKLRFALAEPNVTGIQGVYINRIANMMDYIYNNWDMLLKDMERGTVDEGVKLGDKWRKYVVEKLPPNPKRAGELRAIPYDTLKAGIVTKIWKKVKYIVAIGGENYSYYMDKMKMYAKGIPINYYAYGASEGIFGIPEGVDVPDRYILFPEAGFHEFIPVSGENRDKVLQIEDLQIGEKYEYIFTSLSGLYRYRMGDVLELVGRFGKAPVVKYCYRVNQIISVASEKTNVQQLEKAINLFSDMTKIVVDGYCVQEDLSYKLPRYLFFIECDVDIDKQMAEDILEKCMLSTNYGYRSCADMNEIAPLRIEFLVKGSFRDYEKKLAEEGKRMGQNKLLRILDSDDKKRFFAKRKKNK